MKKIIKENWITRYLRYIATWRKHRKIIKELNGLTDKELADIGISRWDIDRLIWLEEDETRKGRGKK